MEVKKKPIWFKITWLEGIYFQDQELIARWPKEWRQPLFAINDIRVIFEDVYKATTIKERVEEVKLTRFESGFVGENLTLEEYESLDEDKKVWLQSTLWKENETWITQKLQELNAAWIAVVNGEVERYSADLAEYPQEPDILEIYEKRGKFPFIFINKGLLAIEEGSSGWSRTVYPDHHYPTAEIQIESSHLTLRLTADFDTGSSELYANMDLLIYEGLILHSRRDVPDIGKHLGNTYRFYVKLLCVGIVSENSKVKVKKEKKFPVICVLDWTPFMKINKDRQALVGRTLFLKLKPSILLKFKEKKTEVHF